MVGYSGRCGVSYGQVITERLLSLEKYLKLIRGTSIRIESCRLIVILGSHPEETRNVNYGLSCSRKVSKPVMGEAASGVCTLTVPACCESSLA